MAESQFVDELNNKYFGLKDYRESSNCLLRPDEIDTRFFEPDGKPNKHLEEKIANLKNALAAEGVEEYEIYVVGGVAADKPKSGYSGDLDLYVHSPGIKEEIVNYDEEKENLANIILQKINGTIPQDPLERKKGSFTDVMISRYPPRGPLPMAKNEHRIVYNATKYLWVRIQGLAETH